MGGDCERKLAVRRNAFEVCTALDIRLLAVVLREQWKWRLACTNPVDGMDRAHPNTACHRCTLPSFSSLYSVACRSTPLCGTGAGHIWHGTGQAHAVARPGAMQHGAVLRWLRHG